MIGEDGKVEGFSRINALGSDGRVINDLSTGSYDVTVTVGPAYASRRAQAAESMMQFAQAVPAALPLFMDLIPESMDWANAGKIGARLRNALPKGVDPEVDKERDKQQGAPDPAAQEAQQMQIEAARIELQTKDFEAGKAEQTERLTKAQAESAEADAAMKRLQLAQMTGQVDVFVNEQVQARLQQIIAGEQEPDDDDGGDMGAMMQPGMESPMEMPPEMMGADEQQPMMADEGLPEA